MIRRTGIWQTTWDDRILEYLRDNGLATPDEISAATNVPVTTRRISERLRVLSQAEYVAPFDEDYDFYEITGWGCLYLEGSVRADLLVPRPSEKRPGYILG